MQDYNPRNNIQYIYENKIEGKGRSTEDSKYTILIRDLNRYFEYYDGSIVNSGAWFIKQSLKGTKFESLESKNENYLYERLMSGQKNEGSSNANKGYDDDFIYKVSFSNDYSVLYLTYLDSGKVIKFNRENGPIILYLIGVNFP